MPRGNLKFVVSVPRVEGVSVARFREYIEDAVRQWAGQFEPAEGGDTGAGTVDEGDPLGPPCEWNAKVKVKRMLR